MTMRRFLTLGLLIAMSIAAGGWYLVRSVPVAPLRAYGATFSPRFAEQFGLDWKAAYRAMLDDLNIRNVRIAAYWDRVEPRPDEYDFSETDWLVAEAGKRQAEIVFAVGQKLPRWPECFVPDWVKALSMDEREAALLSYVERVVRRYRSSDTVKIWQVENEPFLHFGECPIFYDDLLDREIAAVRALDSRPVMLTDSGELSLWVRAHRRADIFGSTLYRNVWSPVLGNFTYPLPPAFFRLKRAIAERFNGAKPAVIIELQAEPWQHKALYETTAAEHLPLMNPKKFNDTLDYASRTGFGTFYLWGVEWWYWLKATQNMPEMWDAVKSAIQKTQ